LAVAAYLTWVHYAGVELLCAGGGGACERVQTSAYAQVLGVPVALAGLAAYAALLGCLAVPRRLGRSLGAYVALTGAGFSAYLTYIEVAVLHALCQWCLASAGIMSALAAVAVVRLLRAPPQRSSAA